MKNQDMIYTGQLAYKEVDFTFVFDGKKLRLIPPKDKRDVVNENWLWKKTIYVEFVTKQIRK